MIQFVVYEIYINSNFFNSSIILYMQTVNLFKNIFGDDEPYQQLINRLHLDNEPVDLSSNRIHIVADVMNDGTGDYAWIKYIVDICKDVGAQNKNIKILLNLNSMMSDDFFALKKFKKFLDNCEKIIPPELGKYEQLFFIDNTIKNTLQGQIQNILSKYENYMVTGDMQNISQIISKYSNTDGELLDDIRANSSNAIKTDIMKCVGNKDLLSDIAGDHITSSVRNEYFHMMKALQEMVYIEGIDYYFSNINDIFDDTKLDIVDGQDDKCKFSGFDFDTDLFVVYCVNYDLIKKCSKVIKLQEGGIQFKAQFSHKKPPNAFVTSGISKNSLGILQVGPKKIRPHITRDNVLTYLATTNGITDEINYYHCAYNGQITTTDTLRLSVQFQRFVIYLGMLLMIYSDDKYATANVYVFAIEKIFTILPLFDYVMIVQKTLNFFSQYLESYVWEPDNIMIKNKHDVKLVVTKFKRMNPSEPIKSHKISFCEFLAHSDTPVLLTGDCSYQEGICLGKTIFSDFLPNKYMMITDLYDSFDKYIQFVFGDEYFGWKQSMTSSNSGCKLFLNEMSRDDPRILDDVDINNINAAISFYYRNPIYGHFHEHLVRHLNFNINFSKLMKYVVNGTLKFDNAHRQTHSTMFIGLSDLVKSLDVLVQKAGYVEKKHKYAKLKIKTQKNI